jgi:hypothetical protein
MTVSQHLEERYGIKVAPGHKGLCPCCGKKTFSVRKDDTVGKCFHPACGEAITEASLGADYAGSLNQVLDRIKHDFHAELIAQDERESGRRAWSYLIDERRLEPTVVRDLSELGAVPEHYDPKQVFQTAIDAIGDRLAGLREKLSDSIRRRVEEMAKRNEQFKKARKSRQSAAAKTEHEVQWEKDISRLEASRARMIEQRDQLCHVLGNARGWIVFFHTDQHHRVRSIRLRKSGEKVFQRFQSVHPLNGTIRTFPLQSVQSCKAGSEPSRGRRRGD